MPALAALGARGPAGRAVAVLGEMLELGDQSAALHYACGRHAVAAGVQRLVTVGGDAARRLGAAAVGAGLPAAAVAHAATSDEAAAIVARELAAGDLVLVKGSRGIRTDLVVAHLMSGGK